jgi:hypothetical protein
MSGDKKVEELTSSVLVYFGPYGGRVQEHGCGRSGLKKVRQRANSLSEGISDAS